jgi:hypothetical protein
VKKASNPQPLYRRSLSVPRANTGARPARIVTLPMDTGGFPTTIDCPVLTTGDAPAAIASLPANTVSLPTDIDCLVLITEGLPANPKTSKNAHFSLFLV